MGQLHKKLQMRSHQRSNSARRRKRRRVASAVGVGMQPADWLPCSGARADPSCKPVYSSGVVQSMSRDEIKACALRIGLVHSYKMAFLLGVCDQFGSCLSPWLAMPFAYDHGCQSSLVYPH